MLSAIHPLPMREILSQAYALEAGGTVDSLFYMIQGYSRIVGAIEMFAGGPNPATFTIFQGFQNDPNPPGHMQWIHDTDIFNINTNDNIPFNYAVLMKGMYWHIDNTSGQPADFRVTVWLRNE